MKRKTKRKTALLLTLTLLIALVSGCGKNEITFSELFEEDVIIYCGSGSFESFEGKEEKIEKIYVYDTDGTFFGVSQSSKQLGDYAQMSDEELIEDISPKPDKRIKERLSTYKLNVNTDSTGNSTSTESILVKSTIVWRNGREDTGCSTLKFEKFVGHVTVYDSSYMMFEKYGRNGSVDYYLIRDTAKTKGKTVCFDAVGTEGIEVDKTAKEFFE